MKKVFYIILSVILLCGCGPENEEIIILERSEISLVWKGTIQVSFDQKNGQLAYNDKTDEYRVYDDKLANWFTLRCSEKPTTKGQILNADVSWTGNKSPMSYEGLSFIVKKVSDTGLIWLWNTDNRIGIIIKNIQ